MTYHDLAEALRFWLRESPDAGLDDDEALELIESAIRDVLERPNEVAAALRALLREEREERDRCPDCGEELQWDEYREPHPYGSTVAYETITELRCPVHGAM